MRARILLLVVVALSVCMGESGRGGDEANPREFCRLWRRAVGDRASTENNARQLMFDRDGVYVMQFSPWSATMGTYAVSGNELAMGCLQGGECNKAYVGRIEGSHTLELSLMGGQSQRYNCYAGDPGDGFRNFSDGFPRVGKDLRPIDDFLALVDKAVSASMRAETVDGGSEPIDGEALGKIGLLAGWDVFDTFSSLTLRFFVGGMAMDSAYSDPRKLAARNSDEPLFNVDNDVVADSLVGLARVQGVLPREPGEVSIVLIIRYDWGHEDRDVPLFYRAPPGSGAAAELVTKVGRLKEVVEAALRGNGRYKLLKPGERARGKFETIQLDSP